MGHNKPALDLTNNIDGDSPVSLSGHVLYFRHVSFQNIVNRLSYFEKPWQIFITKEYGH